MALPIENLQSIEARHFPIPGSSQAGGFAARMCGEFGMRNGGGFVMKISGGIFANTQISPTALILKP